MLLGDNPNQTYRLRWNTKNSSGLNLSEEFCELRTNSEYFDDGMDSFYNDASKQDTVSSTNDTNDDNFDQFYDKLRRATKQVQIKLEMTTRKKIYPCLKNLFLILQRVNMECG